VAVQAFIDKPYRPVRALGLQIPKSLDWLRVEVLPEESGGVRIRLLAQDESSESARKNAKQLQALLRSAAEVDFSRMGTLGALASLAFGGSKQKIVESIDLYAEKDQIRGLVRMTRSQLLNLSDLLDAFLPAEPSPSPSKLESPKLDGTESPGSPGEALQEGVSEGPEGAVAPAGTEGETTDRGGSEPTPPSAESPSGSPATPSKDEGDASPAPPGEPKPQAAEKSKSAAEPDP
jgi:hypothetical protein